MPPASLVTVPFEGDVIVSVYEAFVKVTRPVYEKWAKTVGPDLVKAAEQSVAQGAGDERVGAVGAEAEQHEDEAEHERLRPRRAVGVDERRQVRHEEQCDLGVEGVDHDALRERPPRRHALPVGVDHVVTCREAAQPGDDEVRGARPLDDVEGRRRGGERPDRVAGALSRAQLEHLAQEDEDGDDGGGLEIDRDRAVERAKRRGKQVRGDGGDDAVEPCHASAERDQREHVEVPGAQRDPATHEERPTRVEHDRRREQERARGGDHEHREHHDHEQRGPRDSEHLQELPLECFDDGPAEAEPDHEAEDRPEEAEERSVGSDGSEDREGAFPLDLRPDDGVLGRLFLGRLDLGRLDQALRPGFRIGHDDRAAARGAFGIECGKDVEAHRSLARGPR